MMTPMDSDGDRLAAVEATVKLVADGSEPSVPDPVALPLLKTSVGDV